MLTDQLATVTRQIDEIEAQMRRHCSEQDEAVRLLTIPGVGPVTASAILAGVPDIRGFRSGRDFGSDPLQLARALLKQLPDLDGRVPIDEIALALDIIGIEVAPLRGIEAGLQCDARKSRGQIVVREASSSRRRRYSIGHELGHFLNERHLPTSDFGFDCTAQDMAAPQGNPDYQR